MKKHRTFLRWETATSATFFLYLVGTEVVDGKAWVAVGSSRGMGKQRLSCCFGDFYHVVEAVFVRGCVWYEAKGGCRVPLYAAFVCSMALTVPLMWWDGS